MQEVGLDEVSMYRKLLLTQLRLLNASDIHQCPRSSSAEVLDNSPSLRQDLQPISQTTCWSALTQPELYVPLVPDFLLKTGVSLPIHSLAQPQPTLQATLRHLLFRGLVCVFAKAHQSGCRRSSDRSGRCRESC